MSEVRSELQVIKMANSEAMEVQRQAFQLELDKVREKLKLVELTSETLTGELRVPKVMKVTQDERPAKNTSGGNKVLTTLRPHISCASCEFRSLSTIIAPKVTGIMNHEF